MKNILVVGVLNTGNLGDDLIYDIVYKTCKTARGDAPITLNIGNIKSINKIEESRSNINFLKFFKSNLSWSAPYKKYVEFKRVRKLERKLDAIDFEAIDTIVFAGGQLFFDYFIPLISIIVKRAEKDSVKVIFNACGVGTVSKKNAKKLQHIIKSTVVDMVTLRESPQLLADIVGQIPNINIMRVNDPALLCASNYPLKTNKKEKIGISLIDPIILKKHNLKISMAEYLAVIKKIISFCNENNLSYELFSTGDKRDVEFMRKIQKNIYPDIVLVERPLTIDDMVNTIGSYSYIISFRLHSHIVAASYGVPSFALIWDKKVKEFMSSTGREKNCFDFTKRENVAALDEKLNRFFQEEYTCDVNKFRSSNKVLLEQLIIENGS